MESCINVHLPYCDQNMDPSSTAPPDSGATPWVPPRTGVHSDAKPNRRPDGDAEPAVPDRKPEDQHDEQRDGESFRFSVKPSVTVVYGEPGMGKTYMLKQMIKEPTASMVLTTNPEEWDGSEGARGRGRKRLHLYMEC